MLSRRLSLRDPSAKVFNSLDMSEHQFVSAMLIEYVFRMGVDPRFVSIAASTPPMEMHFLSEQMLDDLKVRWSPKKFEPWSIEPRGGGVVAVTRSKDRTRTATIACFADGTPRLVIVGEHYDHIDAEWLSDAIEVIQSVVAFDLKFPKNVLKANFTNGILVLEFTLKGVEGRTIASSKWPGVSVEGPRYMWGPFTYAIPRENAEAAIGIALKNCISP